MKRYGRFVHARLVHCACDSPVIEHQMRLAVLGAPARVLEVGFGSGLNLPHCDRSASRRSELTTTMPSHAWHALRR